MGIDQRLIDLLCCPVSKVPVVPATARQIEYLNREIAGGAVKTVAGSTLSAPLAGALLTTDGKVLYRIDDGIPVMLPEEGIGTTQFADFPR
jgi:uncharacterized protein YbaR (Trm112 family)